MRSVLAVSWCMPPMLFPRSIQVARTLKHLAGFGWRSTVLTADPGSFQATRPRDEALARFYDGAYELVPVPALDDTRPMLALWRVLPWLQMLPDARRPWIRPAVRAGLRLAAARPFDALVSFAQPWSDHLVASALHRTLRLPWLAHFSDPWTDNPYFSGPAWVRDRWRRWEEEVVRDADAVVFVTDETRDLVMRKYPEAWRAKVHVIPHAFDPDIARAVHAPSAPHDRLRVVYTGNFFAGRTPDGLLDAIAALPPATRARLDVRFIGQMLPGYDARLAARALGSTISLAGPMPFLDSLREAAAADVLLIVDAPNEKGSVFLPSKLVDYLMLRKPILGLTPERGASAKLLRRAGCPVVSPDDPAAIAAALTDLVDRAARGALHVGGGFDQVAREFSMDVAAGAFDRILSSMARAPRVSSTAAAAPWEPVARAK